jgi:hypothetical protein
VRIETLDNPGWSLNIDLVGTTARDRPFVPVRIERSEKDWIDARVLEQKFVGHCGPQNLEELLDLFLAFAAN